MHGLCSPAMIFCLADSNIHFERLKFAFDYTHQLIFIFLLLANPFRSEAGHQKTNFAGIEDTS
jgi:hypothetical protein